MLSCGIFRTAVCRSVGTPRFGGNVEPSNAFDLEGLIRIQREAQRITSELTRLGAAPAQTDGWDSRRAVRVTVDGSGRVVDAELGLSWRDILEPAELGAAVVEAVDTAEADRMDAWKRATPQAADPADAGHGIPDLSDAGGPGRFRSLSDPAVQESTRELYYLAMDAIDRLGEAGRAMDQATTDPVRGHSPDRLVTVTVDGGRVTAVDFDQSWLSKAPAVEITRRLRAAFEAAAQAGPESAAVKALDDSSIRELREVSADPQELLRRLGLG
jgi:DNA-binding protein YbaB